MKVSSICFSFSVSLNQCSLMTTCLSLLPDMTFYVPKPAKRPSLNKESIWMTVSLNWPLSTSRVKARENMWRYFNKMLYNPWMIFRNIQEFCLIIEFNFFCLKSYWANNLSSLKWDSISIPCFWIIFLSSTFASSFDCVSFKQSVSSLSFSSVSEW